VVFLKGTNSASAVSFCSCLIFCFDETNGTPRLIFMDDYNSTKSLIKNIATRALYKMGCDTNVEFYGHGFCVMMYFLV